MAKFLDDNGLLYLWNKIKSKFVEQVAGKGLSTNDYTSAEKTKLAGVETGANKTTVTDALNSTSTVNALSANQGKVLNDGKVDKVAGKALSTNDLTDTLKTNYDTAYTHSQSAHAPVNAEQNVQSDWNVTDAGSDAFIKNKPVIPEGAVIDATLSDTSTNPVQNKVIKAALDSHTGATNNPHSVTKAQVGLGSVDNTKQIPYSEKGAPMGVATLDAEGYVYPDQIFVDDVLFSDREYPVKGNVIKAALDTKLTRNTAITGATKTKITYDANGLVTGGGNLSAGDIPDIGTTYTKVSTKGQPNGVASLDSSGLVPSAQLPSFVDDVVELLAMATAAPSSAAVGDKYFKTTDKKIYTATATNTWGTTGETPEKGKIYINLSDNKSYRWGGSEMVLITSADMVAITNAEIDIVVAT